jgi:tRNA(Ile)-lysidine synthase
MSSALEVQVYNFLSPLRGKSFLLALSGGRDSMALLKIFSRLAPKLKLKFSVGHVHHGYSVDPQQFDFRNQCYTHLKKHCTVHNIPFLSNVSSLEAVEKVELTKNSEAEFRRFRQTQFKNFLKKQEFDFLVFAHHRDDLFETRLIRMLRGTGPQGLKAMSMLNGRVLRPFLHTSQQELKKYLAQDVFFQDPSNQSTRYLRNWLRNQWLPQLEKRRSGAIQSLQQSLELCVDALETAPSLDFCFDGEGRVLRSEYAGLPLAERKRVWALYLKQMGVQNYGLSHINELVKRLDVEQKDLTFRLLKKRWLANARHIWSESKNELE